MTMGERTTTEIAKTEYGVETQCISRRSDWCAYYHGKEESGPWGYGSTEQEAVDHLLFNWPREANGTA